MNEKEIKDKQGVLLANENGKLMISKETIENLVEAVTKEYKMAKEVTSEFLLGKTEWGVAKTVGIKEGYIEFVQDDPLYIQVVPQEIREKMADILASIKDGSLKL